VALNFNVQTKIRINGQEYASVDEMPPAVRELYQSTLVKAKAVQSTKIIFNGQEYSSPDDMPPEVRALYQAAMNTAQNIPPRLLDNPASPAVPANRFTLRIRGGRLFIGRWFQLSLLSAGMMLIVLGLEVHLNTRLSLDAAQSHYERGWPFIMYGYGGETGIRMTDAEVQDLRRARGTGLRRRSIYPGVPTVFFWQERTDIAWVPGASGPAPADRWIGNESVFWDGEWYVREMLLNLGVAAILCGITGIVCEILLRRREARRT
jgi:hypothetical protein